MVIYEEGDDSAPPPQPRPSSECHTIDFSSPWCEAPAALHPPCASITKHDPLRVLLSSALQPRGWWHCVVSVSPTSPPPIATTDGVSRPGSAADSGGLGEFGALCRDRSPTCKRLPTLFANTVSHLSNLDLFLGACCAVYVVVGNISQRGHGCLHFECIGILSVCDTPVCDVEDRLGENKIHELCRFSFVELLRRYTIQTRFCTIQTRRCILVMLTASICLTELVLFVQHAQFVQIIEQFVKDSEVVCVCVRVCDV